MKKKPLDSIVRRIPLEMRKKRCSKCKDRKLLREFHLDRSRQDGRQRWCKVCLNAANKRWAKQNPEKAAVAKKGWTKQNPEKSKAYSKKWRGGNPKKVKAYSEKYTRENPEKVKANTKRFNAAVTSKQRRNYYLRETYGITLDEYNEMLAEQNGLCAMCGEELEPLMNGRHHPVDHDHSKKGRESVRGIVHNWCNILIGHVENDAELLRKVEIYLLEKSLAATVGRCGRSE